MSAELLRRAASLMRERARAASAEPWRLGKDERDKPSIINGWNIDDNTLAVTVYGKPRDAEHIASWHPDVALLVATLLDLIAKDYDFLGIQDEQEFAADDLAHAYLGEPVDGVAS